MKNGKCPKCNPSDITHELGVLAHIERIGLAFVRLGQKDKSVANGFQAWMCGDWG